VREQCDVRDFIGPAEVLMPYSFSSGYTFVYSDPLEPEFSSL
jgi:hypothetical protein